MTVCAGCNVETNTSICCPTCLEYNKRIFYCSQECYETNYKRHKKMHHFIKMAMSEDIHKKINEVNKVNETTMTSTITANDLPVLIFNSEIEKNNQQEYNKTSLSAENIHTFRNFDYLREGKTEPINQLRINHNMDENEKAEMQKNLQEYPLGRKNVCENKQRKKICNTSRYNVMSDNNFLSHNENGEEAEEGIVERREGTLENELYHQEKPAEKMKEKNKTRGRTVLIENKMNKKKSFSIFSWNLSWFYHLFSSKYNLVLPYYEDIEMEKRKSPNKVAKTKMTHKQYIQLKNQLKKKRIAQLFVILTLLIIIVVISTFLFFHVLEKIHNKNLSSLNLDNDSRSIGDVNNKNHIPFQDIKAHIYAVEQLKQEINEMKEVLYIHNLYMQKHFNFTGSFNLFNNPSTKKEKITGKKKNEDYLNNFSPYDFFKESPTTPTPNTDGAEEKNTRNSVLIQSFYDNKDINEVNQTKTDTHTVDVETNVGTAEDLQEIADIRKEEQLIMEKAKNDAIKESEIGKEIGEIKKNENGEWENSIRTNPSIIIETDEKKTSNDEEQIEIISENKKTNNITNNMDDDNNLIVEKKGKVILNENSINQHQNGHINPDTALVSNEMNSFIGDVREQIHEHSEPSERKSLVNKINKNKQQTI